VVHRDLYEVVNPQPKALAVIRRLLDWIGRVDFASQRGGARPAFKTNDGDPIFPCEDEKWWLTNVQQRKKLDEVQQQFDEDGPLSECDDQKNETDDEDPTSEEECEESTACAPGYKADRAQWAERPKPD